MGMDVYGNKPSDTCGEYFRNNVWWWRPLWDYCVEVAPELCGKVDGHSNGGDGLNAEQALRLSAILSDQLESGATGEYEIEYREAQAKLPRVKCSICNGTGIRTDKVGMEMGQPYKELSPEMAILTARTRGWCNACQGAGDKEHFDAGYPFDIENVAEFAKFLETCGGFKIC